MNNTAIIMGLVCLGILLGYVLLIRVIIYKEKKTKLPEDYKQSLNSIRKTKYPLFK